MDTTAHMVVDREPWTMGRDRWAGVTSDGVVVAVSSGELKTDDIRPGVYLLAHNSPMCAADRRHFINSHKGHNIESLYGRHFLAASLLLNKQLLACGRSRYFTSYKV